MESERQEFIDTILNEKEAIANLMSINFNITRKSSTLSEFKRLEGNKLFVKDSHTNREHENILRLYSESICLAPEKSEDIALAYGNRSAFLVHIKKYEASILDIDRALNITCFKPLKIKLLCRKVKCLSALNHAMDEKILEKIESLLNDVPPKVNSKKNLVDLFVKTRALVTTQCNVSKIERSREIKELDDEKNIFESVAIEYNEKYGRHLVVNRNMEPGEIIFVERYYASCLNYEKELTHCHHCFQVCWSGLPCDSCSWVMFCSEVCKRQALGSYHDVECSIIPYVKSFGHKIFWNVHLCIRIMIIALKEAGGIGKLRRELESIDKLGKDLLMDRGVENKFSSVYSLSGKVSKQQLMIFSVFAPTVVIFVGKYTTLLGQNFRYSKIEDLATNKDFVFLGSLFIKLLKIRHANSYLLSNSTLSPSSASKQQSTAGITNESDEFKNSMGCSLTLVGSLINHSCNPNVRRCFTRDKKIIIYAVQPIKKGSQIFDCYGPNFYEADKKSRQDYLKQYMFTCKCPACVNDWKFKKIVHPGIAVNGNEAELFEKLQKLSIAVRDKSGQCDATVIQELSRALKQAAHYLLPNASITCMFYPLIVEAFNRMYGFKKDSFTSCAK